ncbi:MAG TPA: GDP-mannose 4,6-dehydratase [Candidatus Polarisedimenticolia bacterium]|jgi:GDPmannose 4,6-dehydratase
MPKRALITGITGQDGAYLAELLLGKGYEVYGTFRRISTPNFWRLQALGLTDKVNLIPADLADTASMIEAITIAEPQEIYHLAAQTHVAASFEQPIATAVVTGIGVTRVLEAIRNIDARIRFYQASSSELFGNGEQEPLTEASIFQPASPYAASKLYGFWITRIYREAYGLFASNGILFNHESPLRGLEFVTRKVSNGVAKIALGLAKELHLGNLDARRDWGYAPEYVEAMWLMMQQKTPDDFVIATNESHSVRELVDVAFKVVNLDWESYVKVDKRFLRPIDVLYLQGDNTKSIRELGWRSKVRFEELVRIMVTEDLSRWKRHLDGERFAWDAPNHLEDVTVLTRALRV